MFYIGFIAGYSDQQAKKLFAVEIYFPKLIKHNVSNPLHHAARLATRAVVICD